MMKLEKGEKLVARGYGYKVYQRGNDYYIDTGRAMAWNYGPTLEAVAEFLYYQGYIDEKNVDAIKGV
jgi:hypothetical protein